MMANAFDSYLRGKQQAMQEGQQMLAMEQGVQKMQREQGLRDVLSGAYDPDSGMDMQNALSAMYEGGYAPEAMALEQKQRTLSGATPSMVNEYKFWSQLPKGDQEKYLQVKRAQKFLDVGEGFVAPTMTDPTVTKPVVKRELKPTEELPYISKKGEAAKTGAALGTAKVELADMEASLPSLIDVTSKLSRLGKVATFTKAGQARDAAARQFGGTTEGAVARADYIATVNNEVLPLLRQTFGAAFTAQEGESLKITLGDPNSSPAEKEAQLNAFIESKKNQIKSKKRRIEGQPTAPKLPKKGSIQGGYIFTGGDPANPKSWKKQ